MSLGMAEFPPTRLKAVVKKPRYKSLGIREAKAQKNHDFKNQGALISKFRECFSVSL